MSRGKCSGWESDGADDRNASAHVRIDGLASATLVPAEAIHREAGAEYVLVKSGQGFERRPVELGLRTPTTVAVVSGVRAGEQVALGAVK